MCYSVTRVYFCTMPYPGNAECAQRVRHAGAAWLPCQGGVFNFRIHCWNNGKPSTRPGDTIHRVGDPYWTCDSCERLWRLETLSGRASYFQHMLSLRIPVPQEQRRARDPEDRDLDRHLRRRRRRSRSPSKDRGTEARQRSPQPQEEVHEPSQRETREEEPYHQPEFDINLQEQTVLPLRNKQP